MKPVTKHHADTLRTYQLSRGGLPVRVTAMGTTYKRKALHEQLSPEWIVGLDTESHKPTPRSEELVTSLVTLAFHDVLCVVDMRSSRLTWIDAATREVLRTEAAPRMTAAPQLRAIETVFALLFAREGWAVDEPCPSASKQRKKLTREDRARRGSGGRTGRDGRRLTVPARLVCLMNLRYDLERLFSDPRSLRRMYAGVNSWRMPVGDRYELEWVRYLDSGASQFLWYVRDRETKRVMRLKGLDVFNYWKTSLDNAARSLGVGEKAAVDKADFDRDLASFSDAEWAQFANAYAANDAAITRGVYLQTVELLCTIEARVIARDGTIPPSAPAAAAAIAFAKAFELHDVDEWHRLPEWAERHGALAYHGARVFCARPGVWPGLVTLDLKSAYPTVMAMLPDPVTTVAREVEPSVGFPLNSWRGKWGVLYVSGEALDSVYPAFPQREANGTMRWHVGPFANVPVTIPELVIGVAAGALRIDEVHGGVELLGSSEKSFLRAFVLEMYGVKESNRETNKPRSMLGKLLLNSAYGKLIQVDALTLSWGEQCEFEEPQLTPSPKARFARALVLLLANDGDVDPAQLWFGEADDPREALTRATFVNSRDRLRASKNAPKPEERAACEARLYAGVLCGRFGATGETVAIGDFLRETTSHRAGAYFMPLYAAQITGFVTAAQGAMARCTQAYAGDTDSVFVPCPSGRVEDVPGFADYFTTMQAAGYLAPRAGGDTIGDTTLGRWELEMSPSTESILLGRKRYSNAYAGPNGETLYKQAHHGVPNVPKEMKGAELHEHIRTLYTTGRTAYETRKSPRKGREAARSGATVGQFVSKRIEVMHEATAHTTRDLATGVVHWDRASLTMVRTPRGFVISRFAEAPLSSAERELTAVLTHYRETQDPETFERYRALKKALRASLGSDRATTVINEAAVRSGWAEWERTPHARFMGGAGASE